MQFIYAGYFHQYSCQASTSLESVPVLISTQNHQ